MEKVRDQLKVQQERAVLVGAFMRGESNKTGRYPLIKESWKKDLNFVQDCLRLLTNKILYIKHSKPYSESLLD